MQVSLYKAITVRQKIFKVHNRLQICKLCQSCKTRDLISSFFGL